VRDGRTAKQVVVQKPAGDLAEFLERFDATLVVERGAIAGEEHLLDRAKLVLGRGAGADLRFEDSEMSSQHALIEFTGAGFRISDLGSTNGIRVNGEPVQAHDLETGDRLEVGQHVLRLRVEALEREPRVYCIPDD
jgi:pSer/pThr/pTyr-binding forkhead associated (FHA) protein